MHSAIIDALINIQNVLFALLLNLDNIYQLAQIAKQLNRLFRIVFSCIINLLYAVYICQLLCCCVLHSVLSIGKTSFQISNN